jgi:hypothetical protein
MLGVEDVSNELSVNVGVTTRDIFTTGGVRDGIGLHFEGVIDHLVAALNDIFGLKGILGAILLVELVEDDGHGLGVSDVLTEVLDLKFVMSSFMAVEVNPSDENLFGLKLEDISKFLISFLEAPDLVAFLQVNGLNSEELTGLCENRKNRSRLELKESRSIDAHHLNLTLKSIESEVNVSFDLEDTHLTVDILVDGSFKDGLGVELLDKSNQKKTVGHTVEELVLRSDGESISNRLIPFEKIVDGVGEGVDLFFLKGSVSIDSIIFGEGFAGWLSIFLLRYE